MEIDLTHRDDTTRWTAAEKQGNFSQRLTGQTRQVLSPVCDGTMLTVDTSAQDDPVAQSPGAGSSLLRMV